MYEENKEYVEGELEDDVEMLDEGAGDSVDVVNMTHHGHPIVSYSKERSDDGLPVSVDWREGGYISKVKHQSRCGSCWAFSAAGTLESAYAILTGKHGFELSE